MGVLLLHGGYNELETKSWADPADELPDQSVHWISYSWSVFAGPLAERLTALGGAAYSASDLGIVFTVYNIPGPFCMIAGGWLNRRIEVRRLIQMGSVLFVAGLLLCSRATTLGGLVVGFGLLVGFGVGTVYGCTVNNSVKLFPDKRGAGRRADHRRIRPELRAGAASGQRHDSELGGQCRIPNYCRLLCSGAATGVCICGAGAEEAGQMLPGGGRDMSWREMLCQKKFYGMCAMLLCGGLSGMMVISSASDMAQVEAGFFPRGCGPDGFGAFPVQCRRPRSAGILSDKLGRIGTLSLVFPISVAALCALFFLWTGLNGGICGVHRPGGGLLWGPDGDFPRLYGR